MQLKLQTPDGQQVRISVVHVVSYRPHAGKKAYKAEFEEPQGTAILTTCGVEFTVLQPFAEVDRQYTEAFEAI